MPVVQFFGGPWDGKVKAIPKLEPTLMVHVAGVPNFPRIAADPAKLVVHQDVAYRRETLSYSVCSNVLCDWSIQANVYVAAGAMIDVSMVDESINAGTWEHRFKMMPKPDFLTQFEDWFLWTAYWFGAKCREVRSLEREVFEAMNRAQVFVARHYGQEEQIEDYVYNAGMMPVSLDPFGYTRYDRGKR